MILDSLKSFEKYVNLHASFGKVLEFIRKNDLHTLSEGKHIIEGARMSPTLPWRYTTPSSISTWCWKAPRSSASATGASAWA